MNYLSQKIQRAYKKAFKEFLDERSLKIEKYLKLGIERNEKLDKIFYDYFNDKLDYLKDDKEKFTIKVKETPTYYLLLRIATILPMLSLPKRVIELGIDKKYVSLYFKKYRDILIENILC